MARRKKEAEPKATEPEKLLPDSPIEGLTWKQRLFVHHYLQNGGIAVDAARKAGYKCPHPEGVLLLRKPTIKAAISAKVTSAALSADEVLARYAELASVNMGDFISVTEDGRPVVNLVRAKKAGKLGLLRKFKPGPHGASIEVHDPLRALEQLAKYHGLVTSGDDTAENRPETMDQEAAKRAIQAANNGGGEAEPEATSDDVPPEYT